jgi:hypothetical protein
MSDERMSQLEQVEEYFKQEPVAGPESDKNAELSQVIDRADTLLGSFTAMEIARNPVLRRVTSTLLAAAIILGLSPRNLSSASAETPSSTSTENEFVVNDEATSTLPAEAIKNQEVKEIADETGEALSEIDGVVSLETLDVSEFTSSAKRFHSEMSRTIEKAKEEHLLGAERHKEYDRLVDTLFEKISATEANPKRTAREISEQKIIARAAQHDFNSIVRAGLPEHIVAAGRKAGYISRERSAAVAKAMFTEGHEVTFNLGKELSFTDTSGEKQVLDNDALFAQIIGNKLVLEPATMDKMNVEGIYDMDKLDPESAEKIRSNREFAEKLVDYQWSEIAGSLSARGVDTTGREAEIRDKYISAIQTGESQTIVLEQTDERTLGAKPGEVENLKMINEISSELASFFGATPSETRVTLLPSGPETKDSKVIHIDGEMNIFAGHISEEQLCRGNFGILLEFKIKKDSSDSIKIHIDESKYQEISALGIPALFDPLEAVLPQARGKEGLLPGGEGRNIGVKPDALDAKFKVAPMKEDTVNVKQHFNARGTSADGKISGNKQTVKQSSNGGNRAAKLRHTGKKDRPKMS